MKLGINGLLDWVRNHYDRVLAFAIVASLVATLIFLFVQFGVVRHQHQQFERWMRDLHPEREQIDAVSDAGYQKVMAKIAEPAQLATGEARTRWIFVPESRFSCAECGHPVPVDAEHCPFCDALVTPPEIADIDHDGDGIPSWWEREHGLNPNDPADAQQDWDGDGFTNLEEYLYGTDPNDPQSHPPLIDWLIVENIDGERFELQFRSRVRTRDGDFRFGINYALPNGDTKTDFVEIGGEVSGFVIESYEEITVPAPPPRPGTVDRSELTIRSPRGDRIVLVKDEPVLHVEQTAHMRMGREAPAHDIRVRVDESFTLDGKTYRVIEIDAASRAVVLEEVSEGTRYTVTPEIRPTPVVRQAAPDATTQGDALDEETETIQEPDLFHEMMR